MQIPDPGYAGTNYEIYADHEELDFISFWDECEYVDDEYWDNGPISSPTSKQIAKRKRDEYAPQLPLAKKRRALMENLENVQFVSMRKRLELYYQPPPRLGDVKAFALLPDWRDRFAKDTGVFVEKAMPEEMKKAAEAQDQDTPPKKQHYTAFADGADDQEWMDEDEAEDEDGEAEGMPALDLEALKSVLKQRLRDAGLKDMDENAMMSAISKMLSGDEDALGDLTNTLLGQAAEGNDSAVSGWLSQQGVSLDEAAEDDDASSVATAELPSIAGNGSESKFEVSPPDSAIEVAKQSGETKQMAMHGSSPSASARKRSAPQDTDDQSTSKRKRVTFDAPAASENTELPATENGNAEKDEDATPENPTEAEATAIGNTSPSPKPAKQSISHKTTTATAKATSANDKAVINNNAVSTNASDTKSYAKPTAAAAAKQTRKRKAEDDTDNAENIAPTTSMRPAKRAAKAALAAPEAEPAARRTRSARAKAGK